MPAFFTYFIRDGKGGGIEKIKNKNWTLLKAKTIKKDEIFLGWEDNKGKDRKCTSDLAVGLWYFGAGMLSGWTSWGLQRDPFSSTSIFHSFSFSFLSLFLSLFLCLEDIYIYGLPSLFLYVCVGWFRIGFFLDFSNKNHWTIYMKENNY